MIGETPEPNGKDGNRLAPGVRVVTALAGVTLIVLAAVVWWPAPQATVQNRTETKVFSSTAGPTRAKRKHAKHCRCVVATKRTTKTVTTSRIVNGRIDHAAAAEPEGSPTRRSEGVTIALLAGAVLMLLLAAVGRVPSKVSVGAASAEWPALTSKETETLATKVTEKARERGVEDPSKVGSALARAYSEALVEKRRQATVPSNLTWGADIADAYFNELADKAVSEAAEQ